MTFIGPIVITARLEIKTRPKDIAAALVDHLYEIYFKKLHKIASSLSTIVLNSRDRQGMYGMQHFRTPRNAPYNRL